MTKTILQAVEARLETSDVGTKDASAYVLGVFKKHGLEARLAKAAGRPNGDDTFFAFDLKSPVSQRWSEELDFYLEEATNVKNNKVYIESHGELLDGSVAYQIDGSDIALPMIPSGKLNASKFEKFAIKGQAQAKLIQSRFATLATWYVSVSAALVEITKAIEANKAG